MKNLFFFLLILVVSETIASSNGIEKKPNFIIILADDLGYGDVGFTGSTQIKTPNIDALADEGVIFTQGYVSAPVCGPSRASFLHGLYPQSTGVLDNKSDIRQVRPGTISMPQRFKESGYWTGSVGKVFHNTNNDPGEMAWNEVLRFAVSR